MNRALAIIGAAAAAVLILGWLVWPAQPGALVLQAGTPHYVVTTTVDSVRVGMTAVDVDLNGRTNGVATPSAVEIEAEMPLMGHVTPPVILTSVSGGHYHADGLDLMMTGPWELVLSIDTDHLALPISVSG